MHKISSLNIFYKTPQEWLIVISVCKILEGQNAKKELIKMYRRERVLKPYCASDKVKMYKILLEMEEKKKRNIQNNWTSS